MMARKTNTHIFWPQGVCQQDLLTKKIQFAWDIHETLARKNKTECAAITLRYSSTLLKNARALRIGLKTITKKEEYIAAEAYAHYFEQHDYTHLARYITEVANAYVPIKGISKLLEELAQKGHEHRIASNIGKAYLPILVNRFSTKSKTPLFSYMNGGTIIDYGLPLPDAPIFPIKSAVHCAVECKPKDNLFQIHTMMYNQDNSSVIVFIDDKIKNIQAAARNGWVGIKFSSVKKLRADLIGLGLL
ncbi:hypothetical protein Noda2021_08940 [Candidatus Dependentiae bacterium Noda2021]|nr:hypothetical protein Noda2021_08940 [Candidatus Dependentiae bacterium Noda2021]